jgi:hypothetical protein
MSRAPLSPTRWKYIANTQYRVKASHLESPAPKLDSLNQASANGKQLEEGDSAAVSAEKTVELHLHLCGEELAPPACLAVLSHSCRGEACPPSLLPAATPFSPEIDGNPLRAQFD